MIYIAMEHHQKQVVLVIASIPTLTSHSTFYYPSCYVNTQLEEKGQKAKLPVLKPLVPWTV